MNKPLLQPVCLLLILLLLPLQVSNASPEQTIERISTTVAFKMLEAGSHAVIRALPRGEKQVLLATIAMNKGKTSQALIYLNHKAVKTNRLVALMKAEAYRRQSVQAADRAGHYAHAVNKNIGTLRQARITKGMDAANVRLQAFLRRLNQAQALSVKLASVPVVKLSNADLTVVQRPSSRPVAKVKQQGEVALDKSIKLSVVKKKPAAVQEDKVRSLKPALQLVQVKSVQVKPVPVKSAALKPAVVAPDARQVVSAFASVHQAVEAWRKDWASLDSQAYLQHYDKAFKTLKYDYTSWNRYKRRVNAKKTYIKVSISDVNIIPSADVSKTGEAVLVTFQQRYQSSNYNAVGRKQLYMARKNKTSPWLILYEGAGS